MIRSIIAYGNPVLRKISSDIDKNYPDIQQLIADMFETMYASDGVGLAAPQIGLSIRLFVIDATPFVEDYPEAKDFKKVFINPHVIEESGDEWLFNEGCLSFPGIHEDVSRKSNVKIKATTAGVIKFDLTFCNLTGLSKTCAPALKHPMTGLF